MRLAEARKGDRVVLKGTVMRIYNSQSEEESHSVVMFDGASTPNYVLHGAEVEIIERPWKVGDRYQARYGRGFAQVLGEPCEILAIEGDYVFYKNINNGTCSVCKLEILKEAARLRD